jgi:hypothetical protein
VGDVRESFVCIDDPQSTAQFGEGSFDSGRAGKPASFRIFQSAVDTGEFLGVA